MVKYHHMKIHVTHYKWNRTFKRWDRFRESSYELRVAVVEAVRALPFLSQKRQQLEVLPD
jgi:hypothetical protein